MPDGHAGHVIVAGLTTIGVRVVEQLSEAGVTAVVLTEHPDQGLVGQLRRHGTAIIHESSGSVTGLQQAGIASAAAVVAVHDDDIANLSAGLLAEELNPGVRLVLRMHRDGLGRRMSTALPSATVLDLSSLAASSFVGACLGSRALHTFTLDAETVVVGELTPSLTAPSTLREVYGDLTPVALVRPDGSMQVCPGRDTAVLPGDKVALVAFPDDLAARGLAPQRQDAAASRARRRGRPVRALRRTLATVAGELDRGFRLVLAAVVAVAVTSTVVLRLAYHPSPGQHFGLLDAAYFSVETMATVGYGDYSYASQSTLLRVFGTIVIITGAIAVATLYAFITNLLVSRRLGRSLGRADARGLSAHVIVCGLGSVGVRVARSLQQEGREVIVIERDEDNRYLDVARRMRVPVLVGDCTSPDVLQRAGLMRASAVAVMTSDDDVNVNAALAATSELGGSGVPVVLRVFDSPLAGRLERAFGLHLVRSVSALAAPYFVGAAAGFQVITTFYVQDKAFMVVRVDVLAGGGLDGVALRDLSGDTRVLAIERAGAGAGVEHTPRRGDRLGGGDRAYLTGPYREILGVLRRNTRLAVDG